MRAEERTHLLPRELQPLPEQRRIDLQHLSGFGPRELHDVAEHVRETVRSIEALQHGEAAPDLDFIDQQRPLGITGARQLQAAFEVLGETLEAAVQLLHGALLGVEDV